jgi:Trk K+ transport system NAD-binding subunit
MQVADADLASEEIPSSYVPFRNANLLSMATAYAIDNEIERPELAHWMNDLGDGHDIQQIEVTADDLVGKTIEELNEAIPGGCLVAEVGRGSEGHVPEPDHRLEYGEAVTFLGESDAVAEAVRRFHPRD